MDNNSFVIYHTYYDTYKRLKKRDPALAAEFIDAILAYGFTGEMPPESSIVWDFGLTTMFSQIDASTNRYERAVKNGGGRPSISISEEDIYAQISICDTWKEIAANLKIDADTLRGIRQKFGLTERNPRKYRNSENRKTEKPNPDSFSVNPNQDTTKTELILQNSENRKTEKPDPQNRKTSVLDDTEVFRSLIKTSTTNDTKNRKTEKPKNETEKPKNLNDNDNVNYNYNDNLLKTGAKEDDTIPPQLYKTEKPKNPRGGEKPNGIRFFPDNDLKTEKTEKLNSSNFSAYTISFAAAQELISTTDRPLFIEGNYVYSEDSDEKWLIIDKQQIEC